MYRILFLLSFIFHTTNGFSCPRPSGTFVNPNDYRSYYVCSNYCDQLAYCESPTMYFTRTRQTCVEAPPDWQTRYSLSGTFRSDEDSDAFIRQEGYNVYISHETTTVHYKLIARYINETHAIGIHTLHRLVNNCIVVFNARVVATNNRAYCYYGSIHPYSSKCDLPSNYSGNYCKTY